jgi:hypothetical protein
MKNLIGKKENHFCVFASTLNLSFHHSNLYFLLSPFEIPYTPKPICVLWGGVLAWKDVREDKEAIVKVYASRHGCNSRLGDGFCIKFQHNK